MWEVPSSFTQLVTTSPLKQLIRSRFVQAVPASVSLKSLNRASLSVPGSQDSRCPSLGNSEVPHVAGAHQGYQTLTARRECRHREQLWHSAR